MLRPFPHQHDCTSQSKLNCSGIKGVVQPDCDQIVCSNIHSWGEQAGLDISTCAHFLEPLQTFRIRIFIPTRRLLVFHVRTRTHTITDNGRLIFGEQNLKFWNVVGILGPPELTVQCPVGTWLKSDWAKYSSLPWAPPCQLGGKTTKRFQCDSLANLWPHLPTSWHFTRLVLVSCE